MGTVLTAAQVAEVLEILSRLYPNPRTELKHRNSFELLVATILSAQSTDAAVNRVTPALFERCPTPQAFLELSQEELEGYLRVLGLYRSKARNLLATCRMLVEEFGGKVPCTREELMRLPGVGRKTANVVLSGACGVPAIAVDTHVFRVSRRLGLADGDNVDEVERQLMQRIPRHLWSKAHHWLIFHGRRTCLARRPRCDECPLAHICLSSPQQGDKAS